MTVGFAAATPEEVDAFHAAGLAAGGADEGQPGPRGHLPGAYAAYLRDPAGNKITAYTFICLPDLKILPLASVRGNNHEITADGTH